MKTITAIPPIRDYDYYLVMFSGGKDSTACFLHLLDLNIPKEKIELWHHLVDGDDVHLMDWECTPDYCRKFAAAFHIPIYFSWKVGGFEGEMLRDNSPTKPTLFETPDGIMQAGGKGKPNTRRMFPQVSSNLIHRWCSPYLKIGVGKTAIINQPRFAGKRILVISGERAEESPGRKHYAFLEPDGADNRNSSNRYRHVDRCRLIHHWKETEVWAIIERYAVMVHPCYYLGYGRCSCKWCIFAGADQMATSYYLSPDQGNQLIRYEKDFMKTMKPGTTLETFITKGTAFSEVFHQREMAQQSVSTNYYLPIFADAWKLPVGAYKRHPAPQ